MVNCRLLSPVNCSSGGWLELFPLSPAAPSRCCALTRGMPAAAPPLLQAPSVASEPALSALLPPLFCMRLRHCHPLSLLPLPRLPPSPLPRCLIAAVAATPNVPMTSAALPLPPVEPPADAGAYAVSAASDTACQHCPHFRRRHPWTPRCLTLATPQACAPADNPIAAPDQPSQAPALGSRPLLTSPRSRLFLMPLPPLAPVRYCATPTSYRPPLPKTLCVRDPNTLARRLRSRCRSRLCCHLRRYPCSRLHHCSTDADPESATSPPRYRGLIVAAIDIATVPSNRCSGSCLDIRGRWWIVVA